MDIQVKLITPRHFKFLSPNCVVIKKIGIVKIFPIGDFPDKICQLFIKITGVEAKLCASINDILS